MMDVTPDSQLGWLLKSAHKPHGHGPGVTQVCHNHRTHLLQQGRTPERFTAMIRIILDKLDMNEYTNITVLLLL